MLREATADTLASKLFLCAAGAAITSLVFAFLATMGQSKPTNRFAAGKSDESQPSSLNWFDLARRYHPGWTLLVGCAMGMGIGMPGTFLSAFAEAKGIDNIAWYWTPYAAIAFAVRIATRKLADEWGTRPTSMLGLICLAASMLAYLPVSTPMLLILPAALAGLAHAFLFPACIAEGNQSFPAKYRGIATTLMLMMFDIGLLIGQPVFGWSVEISRRWGGDGYVAPFVLFALVLLAVAASYWRWKARHKATAKDWNVVAS
jgi:predicted MFS family arabinose efflux permease